MKLDINKYEYIVVGAGLSGVVAATQLANKHNKRVLIIEKRSFIGGNCYDYYQENGILIQKYGPHIFHTNKEEVWNYLKEFTEWNLFDLEVNSSIEGKIVPIPFNLNTIELLFSKEKAKMYIDALIDEFGLGARVSIFDLRKTDNELISNIAEYIFEKSFKNYILKQWGRDYNDLDRLIVDRIPVNIQHDNRYFVDKYQGVPSEGFSKLINNIVDSSNVDVMLDTDFFDIFNIDQEKNEVTSCDGYTFNGNIIYTGAIDEFLGYKYGCLPYRSLKFVFETKEVEQYQNAAVISFPNEFDFTRITEYKKLTGQEHKFTTIGFEYPYEFNFDDKELERYYPIPQAQNIDMYLKYKNDVDKFTNIILLGRLAEYKYYNMDQIIENALNIII